MFERTVGSQSLAARAAQLATGLTCTGAPPRSSSLLASGLSPALQGVLPWLVKA